MEGLDGNGAVETNLLLQGLKFLAKLQSSSSPVAVVRPVVTDANRTKDDGTLKPKLGESRKRQCDSSPSEFDKKAKRRMLNRVSAQNARNRKKTYVDNLEKKLSEIEAENKKLVQENYELKNRLKEMKTVHVPVESQPIRKAETHSNSSSDPSLFGPQPGLINDFMELWGTLSTSDLDFFNNIHLTDNDRDSVTPSTGSPPSVDQPELVGSPTAVLEPAHQVLPLVDTLPPTLSSAALVPESLCSSEKLSDSLSNDFEIQDEELDALVKEMLDTEFDTQTVIY